MRGSSTTILTIDGPVAAGKTTTARALANRLGFTLLDTGAIYRCVALAARQADQSWRDEPTVAATAEDLELRFLSDGGSHRVLLQGADVSRAIRTPEISSGASIVSAHPAVRAALLDLQRRYADTEDIIAEGRDTGTVVFPHADLKIFLTADTRVRADRRHRELRGRGVEIGFDEVLDELSRRDRRDSGRSVAPLVAAEDAVLVDSTELDAGAVIDRIAHIYQEKIGEPSTR